MMRIKGGDVQYVICVNFRLIEGKYGIQIPVIISAADPNYPQHSPLSQRVS